MVLSSVCVFLRVTLLSDCPMQIFRKIMKYFIERFNTDCCFTLLVFLFVLEIFFKKKSLKMTSLLV